MVAPQAGADPAHALSNRQAAGVRGRSPRRNTGQCAGGGGRRTHPPLLIPHSHPPLLIPHSSSCWPAAQDGEVGVGISGRLIHDGRAPGGRRSCPRPIKSTGSGGPGAQPPAKHRPMCGGRGAAYTSPTPHPPLTSPTPHPPLLIMLARRPGRRGGGGHFRTIDPRWSRPRRAPILPTPYQIDRQRGSGGAAPGETQANVRGEGGGVHIPHSSSPTHIPHSSSPTPHHVGPPPRTARWGWAFPDD